MSDQTRAAVRDLSEFRIMLPATVWARIVFAAQETDDWKLRTLIEQAVAEARSLPDEPTLKIETWR
jgi:hypothetical protein